MTTFYYDETYPEEFANDVRKLAARDPSLLERLAEGPRTSGQLELQLRVDAQERLSVMYTHVAGLGSKNTKEVLKAAAALTADMDYLNLKTKAYKTCQALRPPLYRMGC